MVKVLSGDLENAVISHQVFYTIWCRFNALPERFDFSNKIANIGHYPLRPELIESTYILYQSTKNHYYLEVGERILQDLERGCRTSCGFASLRSVGGRDLDDRMESFFLSETLKYLYLLFDTGKISISDY
jgi:ER degradation enhancer, mannosidase alpha-like 1